MTKRLLIDARQAEETRVVLLSGTRIEDFDYETENRKQLKGNVYLARVTRVEPSLQAAFVEYGGNRQGFLAFSEIHPDYYRIPIEDREALLAADRAEAQDEDNEKDAEDGLETVGGGDGDEDDIRPARKVRKYKIQEVISRKQIMLVQVVKEERGNKGAALTTYLSLAGRYCVLMPNNSRGGGVSRKITNIADRKRLKTVVGGLDIPDGMAVIVRTAGSKRTKTEIARDYAYLSKLWNDIRERTLESQAPCIIHEEGNLIKRSIRDIYTSEVEEILVEGEEAYKAARNHIKMLIPSHVKKVKKHEDKIPLFQHYSVESQMDSIHSPQVTLKSGGYLVINQTEALVAVDVNSGRSTRERNIEETALKTNLEAADELARQLRLRDLSGLIVVDFIDMEENRNQHAVERRMKDAMRNDRARIQIGSISHFGLLEMSRQRLRLSINESTSDLCPHCEGTGRVRSVDTAALQTLRSIEDEAQKGKMDEMHITVHRDIALYILNHKRDALAELESRYNITIMLLSDDTLISPEYRIERVGWQGKAPQQQNRRASKSGNNNNNNSNNNAHTESKDAKNDNAGGTVDKSDEDAQATVEAGETDAASDEDQPKRRRRGRRGGRRRRGRRGNENAIAANDDGTNIDSDGQAIASDTSSENATSADATHDAETKADETPAKKSRGRGRKAASAVIETASADNAEAQINDNADNASDDTEATVKPKRPARKKAAAKAKADNGTSDLDDAPDDAPAKAAPKKAAAKKASKAVKKAKVADADTDSTTKAAPKKKARKAASKKSTTKASAPVETATPINNGADNDSATVDARAPISSAPQDVVDVDGDKPAGKTRRGWWSRG
ncbi:ribonuclease E/G [Candidatus Puniceispirillum sp.]|jgi:ribonuclease E|uniref:ribonuclease E/G n=1 Tax=Candidatus Puniceispirillum sp. TaxID=2026719 RepID=UPI001EC4B8D2|nr:ribonuclease E/G [Candidatus Puniceispirillum sp.]